MRLRKTWVLLSRSKLLLASPALRILAMSVRGGRIFTGEGDIFLENFLLGGGGGGREGGILRIFSPPEKISGGGGRFCPVTPEPPRKEPR